MSHSLFCWSTYKKLGITRQKVKIRKTHFEVKQPSQYQEYTAYARGINTEIWMSTTQGNVLETEVTDYAVKSKKEM
ncbi:hypothetical protein RRG08_052535, partial [Elysia crispata]